MNPFCQPLPPTAPPQLYQQQQQLAAWFDQGARLMAAGQCDQAFPWFGACLKALGPNTPENVLLCLGLCKLQAATLACDAALRGLTEADREGTGGQGGLPVYGMLVSTADTRRKLDALRQTDQAEKALRAAVQEAVYYFQLVQQRYPGYAHPQAQQYIAQAQGLYQHFQQRSQELIQPAEERARNMGSAARREEARTHGEITHIRNLMERDQWRAQQNRDYAAAKHDEVLNDAQARSAVGDQEGAASAAASLEAYAEDVRRWQRQLDSATAALAKLPRR
jgi:hypothetical protein